MINGFEEHTAELTNDEKVLANRLALSLAKKVGKDKAVTNKKMREGIKASWNITLSDAKIRKLINYIRRNGIVNNLIATSKGYYVSESINEVKDYIDSLKQRRNAIDEVIKSFELEQQQIKMEL